MTRNRISVFEPRVVTGLTRLTILAVIAICGIAIVPVSMRAQQITPQQIEQARQNPELVRQQIRESGLTTEQIRQRLRAAGYPSDILDQFLNEDRELTGADVSSEALSALDALGVTIVNPEGVEEISPESGLLPGVDFAPDTGLQVFGLNVFRRPTTQFQPLLSGPVPPNYRVGPGDVLVLVLTGDVELVRELAVTREGFILIPQVGQLFVGNLTMEQLDALLRSRLGESYSGIRTGSTQFDVTMARLRTNQIYVLGEVMQPGAYQLASVATMLNALYAAGGVTDRASFRNVRLMRQGDTVAVLDLYDYLLAGDTRNDDVLQQGDVVFVPVRGSQARITGAVVRPAIYELVNGETLSDLVQMSGGFRADAELRRLAVHRLLSLADRGPAPAPRAIIDVPLATREGEETEEVVIPQLTLEDGDSVDVDSIAPLEQGLYATITGMVRKPGRYPWSQDMTLRDLVMLARGTQVGADLREAEISRLPEDRTTGVMAQTVRVPLDSTYLLERDPEGRYVGAEGVDFPSAGSAPETLLRPFDQVTIFRQPEFELQRAVTVTGEVFYPGTYALTRKDERLSNLVSRAGGLTATAYARGGRFYRSFEAAGRVNIDLEAALDELAGPNDVVLQPGDSLHVPEYIPTVRVSGAVNVPTSVLYEEGADLDYYIANAGGLTNLADKRRISVRYANGSARVKERFLFFGSTPTPGPGSIVNVPTRDPEAGIDFVALVGNIAQVLAAAVTVIVVATR